MADSAGRLDEESGWGELSVNSCLRPSAAVGDGDAGETYVSDLLQHSLHPEVAEPG